MAEDADDVPLDPGLLEAWEAETPPSAFADRVVAAWRNERMQRVSRPTVPETRPRFVIWPVVIPSFVAVAALVALFVRPAARAPAQAVRQEEAPARPIGSAAPSLPPGVLPVATLTDVQGSAYVLDQGRKVPATVGRVVATGQAVLAVGKTSSATVEYADGSTIDLGPDAYLSLLASDSSAGKMVFAPVGMFLARVVPQPRGQPLLFLTPHGQVTVVGTRFSATVSGEGTSVRVAEGGVVAKDARGGERRLSAGQSALLVDGATEPAAAVTSSPSSRSSALVGRVLFFVGNATVLPADELMKRRLQNMGLDVKVRGVGDVSPAELKFNALIVISSSLWSSDVNAIFRDVAVPLVTWEESLFDDLGMTGPVFEGYGTDGGNVKNTTPPEVSIKNLRHPLAAGLSGVVRIATDVSDTAWGRPSPFAEWVATVPGFPTQAAVFAYEKGAMMVGMPAPARRVGLPFTDPTPLTLTDAGWALFDAAVRWALGSDGAR